MTRKFRFTFIIVLLAIVSILSIGTVFAKYFTVLPVGDNGSTFNLSITSGGKTFAIADGQGGLYFYKRKDVPSVGTTFDGKTVSKVYYDENVNLETLQASSSTHIPWKDDVITFTSVQFVDVLTPKSTACWFAGFTVCVSFDFTNLDTSLVEDMKEMFQICFAIETLDLSNFNTANVTNTHQMFAMCSALKTIIVSENFVTDALVDSDYMFAECGMLVGGNETPYDGTKLDKTYARIDGKDGLPGYFTYAYNVLNFDDVDGSGAPNAMFSQSNTFIIPSEAPTFEGASFLGWKIAKPDDDTDIGIDSSILYQPGDTFTITKDKETLYAVFNVVTTKAALTHAQASGKSFAVQGGTYSTVTGDGEDVVVTIRDSIIGEPAELTGYFGVIRAHNGATVIVENAEMLEPSGSWGVVTVDTNATIIIRDGTYARAGMLWGGDGTGTLRVEGGTFTIGSWTGMINGGTNIIITGGTFDIDPSAYVASGYSAVDNNDGTWTVVCAHPNLVWNQTTSTAIPLATFVA